MKRLELLSLGLFLFLASCGTASKAYRVVDPRDINKDKLSKTSVRYTPKYKIPYSKTKGVDQTVEWWGNQIDKQYEEYSNCVRKKLNKDANLKKLRTVKVIVVRDSKFECKYHYGRCSGEYDSELNMIVVARKDFEKEGFVPLLKHEWCHANGILMSKHRNHEQVKKCTKY